MPGDAPATVADVAHWYRDPVSCLQSTLAAVLIHAGRDPLAALGSGWEFRHVPGDVRPQEYYWPCRVPGDLAASVLPHTEVTSRWHALGPDSVTHWRETLEAGRLPVIAVDNYHLPFRPAYRDVHAAHLLVLFDVQPDAGTVRVSDAMPPAFKGTLRLEELLRAAGSDLPVDHQDRFFSGGSADARWLDVRLGAAEPPLTRGRLRAVLRRNLRDFTRDGTGPAGHWTGTPGLHRYRDLLVHAVHTADVATIGETYTFGWSQQAQAALHGELLRRTGARWRLPRLSEAGRRVEQVAHRWTAVRVDTAHRSTSPHGPGERPERLVRHIDRLVQAYDDALAAVADALEDL
ncbi:BtrH N-terminal domain-containing protein [Streptomyces sp. NPDC003247]|uniref:BtrH N-terminal domain-containing protein n=1 Tax=Streptomyces sp. NPDC003247 TaxID=3364677 RepID=UPI00367C8F36